MPSANRQVTRRDARREGEPDQEPSAKALDAAERATKDNQRDLTSLSGPIHREPEDD